MGERPYSIPGSGEFELKIQTAHDVFPPNYEDTFARRFFLPGWKNRPVVRKYANQSNYSESSDVLESPAVLGQFFEVPENKQLMTYWDRLDDRLDKIRRSLNISGIFRQLPLFQPPIDPRALIAAGGASGAMVAQPIPHYRYSFLLENAKEMVEMCSSLGAQFQAAMETKSAEQLAMLEVSTSIALNVVNRRIKSNAISVAEQAKKELRLTEGIILDNLNRVLVKLGKEPATDVSKQYNDLMTNLDKNAAMNNASLGGKYQ